MQRYTNRYFENIGLELRQALTHLAKGRKEQAFACYATALQLVNDFAEDVGFNEQDDEERTDESPAPVAPESKPAKKSKRSKGKASAGSAPSGGDGGGVGDPDPA